MIRQIEEIKEITKKPKGKKTKSPSNSPNWRNKEVPETTRIMEEVSEEEQLKIKEQQEVLTTTTETPEKELMMNTSEEEPMKLNPMKLNQASINVLAQIETDNSPLEELWINAKTNISQKLAIQETVDKKEKTLEEMVPLELLNYKDVFDKVMAERFPESRPWDHTIDLKEDFIPTDCKVYPMTLPEQAELDKFIDENLAKGYIRPSKSPMASPFFFVSKKDGKL